MRGGAKRHGGRRPSWLLVSWAACFCAMFSAQTAFAQQQEAELQRELDAVYERLLDDPSDLALNRRMIELALALGDYDAAIGSVERLIFYDPDNPALKVEAARYYFATESYAVARGYLRDALSLTAVAPEVKRSAEALLQEINDETRPSPWAFVAQAGVRYQTNANIAPAVLDGDTEPFFVELETEDWNSFGLAALVYSRAVGNTVLEASLSTYYADQDKVDRLDLGFVELVAGPRLQTDNGRLAIKPYALTQGILLGEAPYQWTYGGGVLVRLTDADDWFIEPQFEYKRRRYFNSSGYPRATLQEGDYYSYGINMGGDFSEKTLWQSRIAVNENFAEADYNSYKQYYASLMLIFGFDVYDWTGWTFSPFASASLTEYDGLAPTEQEPGIPKRIREDFQWNAGATLEIPLSERMGLSVQFQYTDNQSNLSRYNYENYQVTSGPTVRF